MKKYQVIERPIFLKHGTLELTKTQVAPRKHQLKDLGKGRYEIVDEVCFKIGEKIGYDGPVKHLVNMAEIKPAKKEKE